MADEKDTSSKDTGQTEKVSNTPGQDGSQIGEAVLDLTKEYIINPKRPDLKMTGAEMQRKIGLAALASQNESKAQKAQNDLLEAQKELETLREKVQEYQIQEKIAAGLKPYQKQQTQNADDIWETDEEETTDLNAGNIRQMISEVIQTELQRIIGKQDTSVEKVVDAKLQARLEEQERYNKLKTFADTINKNNVTTLKTKFPDVEVAELEKAALYEAARMAAINNAGMALANNDDEAAMSFYDEAQQHWEKYADQISTLMEKQKQLNAEKERQTMLESISQGSVDEKERKNLWKRFKNIKDQEKQTEEILARANEREVQRRRLANTL